MWQQYFLFFQRRRWFRRAWIVQEVALANDLAFQCGEKALLWKDIYELGLLLRESGWRHSLAQGMTSTPGGGIGDEADRLLEYRDQVRSGGPEDPHFSKMFKNANGAISVRHRWFSYLQYMIQEIRRYQASNMKDKIYAVLGLVKGFLPPDLADPIIPDYSLPIVDIYISVTKSILAELPLLSCLSYIGRNPQTNVGLCLPSWVPDYTRALGRVPLIHFGDHALFNSSANSIIKPTLRSFSGNVLQLNGTLVDTVSDTSLPLNYLRSRCYVKQCIEICLKLARKYKTGQGRIEVTWRTLIADTTERPPVKHPAPAEYGNHFHDWLLTLMVQFLMHSKWQARCLDTHMDTLELLADSRSTLLGSKIPSVLPTREEVKQSIKLACEAIDWDPSTESSRYRSEGEEAAHNKILQQLVSPFVRSSKGFYLFDRAFKEVRSDRKLFRTKEGYLGLAPEHVDYGDEIWILNGARVPFVLRRLLRRDASHQLVGEAYVHGIMHGELSSGKSMSVQLA